MTREKRNTWLGLQLFVLVAFVLKVAGAFQTNFLKKQGVRTAILLADSHKSVSMMQVLSCDRHAKLTVLPRLRHTLLSIGRQTVQTLAPRKSVESSTEDIIAGSSIESSLSMIVTGSHMTYESTLAALKAYYDVNGDLILPRRFIVPSMAAYPREWHGLDLSTYVYNINWWKRHVKNRPERVLQLSNLGFVWERLQPEWNLILEALVTYRSMNNNLLVPFRFVVPRGDPHWPRSTWGLPLGNCVFRIRGRNDFLRGQNAVTRREQLDALGFVWDVQEHRFRKFYTALRRFAELEHSGAFSKDGQKKIIRVPSYYVVPQSHDWPEELWGYQLGVKCSAVRKGLYIKNEPRFQTMLADLGFRPAGNADLSWLKVVHASAIWSRRNGRTLDVPFNFVVPEKPKHVGQDEWPWPEYLVGLPLGQRLKDIRVKQAYLKGSRGEERRQQLDALGMNWTPKIGRRKRSY